MGVERQLKIRNTVKLYQALGVPEAVLLAVLGSLEPGFDPAILAGLLDPCVPLSVYRDQEDIPIKELING